MKLSVKIFTFAILLAFCFTLFLTGCAEKSEKCNHSWNFISDTATCKNDGIKTYECKNCGKIKTESSSAKGHTWKETSSTATCTEAGIATYICINCNESKQESVQALGHSYASHGVCKECGQFEYNISILGTFPKTLSYRYGSSCISKCQISKVNFEIQEIQGLQGDYLVAFFYGSKTYDENGAYGKKHVEFTVVLKDSNGNIIDVTNVDIDGLVVTQQFGENGYYGMGICKISRLSKNESYTLEIVDCQF